MTGSKTVLRLEASARHERSLTRALADRFVAEWTALRPDDTIVRRDVGAEPPVPVSEAWIGAAFTPADERGPEQRRLLAASDVLIEELRQAGLILVASPMYDYGMPAALKAWVDQVIRVNETFTFDLARGDWPLEPILGDKVLVLLTSSGEFGFGPGGTRAGMDHLTPHLRTCARYLGVKDQNMHRVVIEYQEFGDKRHRHSISHAHEEVGRLVHELASRDASIRAAKPLSPTTVQAIEDYPRGGSTGA